MLRLFYLEIYRHLLERIQAFHHEDDNLWPICMLILTLKIFQQDSMPIQVSCARIFMSYHYNKSLS